MLAAKDLLAVDAVEKVPDMATPRNNRIIQGNLN
jgi:hypothetical protein